MLKKLKADTHIHIDSAAGHERAKWQEHGPQRLEVIEKARQLAHQAVDAAETDAQITETMRIYRETLAAGKLPAMPTGTVHITAG